MRRRRRGKLCGGKRLEMPPAGRLCGMRSLREAFRTARSSLHCERELKETPPQTAAELIKVGIDSSPCSGALYKLARLSFLKSNCDYG